MNIYIKKKFINQTFASITLNAFIMHKLTVSWLLIVSIILGYLIWSKQTQRIVYVDSNKLLGGYQAMIIARKEYAVKAKGWQARIDTLTSELNKDIQIYERTNTDMSAKERGLASQRIRRKQGELSDYQNALQATAQQEDTKQTQLVINQINAFLHRYGTNHNFDIILVATNSGNIAYANQELDLTDEILGEMNKEYIKK